MNKQTLLIIISLASAVAIVQPGLDSGNAAENNNGNASQSQGNNDGASQKDKVKHEHKWPGMTRTELLESSREKAQIRRQIIEAAQAGYTSEIKKK